MARILSAFAALALATLALGSCKKSDRNPDGAGGTVFYVENNVAGDNQNAILAYRLGRDGRVEMLPGSPFLTGGAGVANPTQALGPDDTDEPLALSADGKRLFAVNQGSNTIAVFNVAFGGKLTPVSGSPFPSGGNNPCSIGVAGSRIFVVNKSDDGNPETTEAAPNYTAFDVAANGALTAVPGSTFTTTPGVSPSHALVSPSQRLLFVDDFLAFMQPAATGTLRGFAIGGDGRLTAAAGTPLKTPETPSAALGLWSHPTQNVLYVGFPLQDKIGVYTYDPATAAPTFVRSVESGAPGGPATAVCWLRTNKAGTRLYALNSGEGSVSVFDLTDAQNPKKTQTLALKNPGPVFQPGPDGPMLVTSEPFHLNLSPNGTTLFVVSQHASPDFSANYNYFHALPIAADGSLSEPYAPVQPPVDARTRPQGAVSVSF